MLRSRGTAVTPQMTSDPRRHALSRPLTTCSSATIWKIPTEIDCDGWAFALVGEGNAGNVKPHPPKEVMRLPHDSIVPCN